jgi:hypothetical protein
MSIACRRTAVVKSIKNKDEFPHDPGITLNKNDTLHQNISLRSMMNIELLEILSLFSLTQQKNLILLLNQRENMYDQTFQISIIKFIQKNKMDILRDKNNILNPFIRKSKFLKILEIVLISNDRIQIPYLRIHLEYLSTKLLLPTNYIMQLNYPIPINIRFRRSLFSNRLECLRTNLIDSQLIISSVEQNIKQTFQKTKKENYQKKRIKRVEKVEKETCPFIVSCRKDKKKVGKLCGVVLLEDEEFCDKHQDEDNNSDLELYPYTCKFIISQSQGKNRERSRKGLECGLLCDDKKNYCKSHLKSTNNIVSEKDFEEVEDENGELIRMMKKNKEIKTVIRCFKIRVYLTKEQRKIYAKIAGDCRKTWNLLTENQNNLIGKKDLELRSTYVTSNKLPRELQYLTDTPKDCRDAILTDFTTSLKNARDQYDTKVEREENRKIYYKEQNIDGYIKKKMREPKINFKRKRDEQCVAISKSTVTLKDNRHIKIYPKYFKKSIMFAVRTHKDKKFKQLLNDGIKHDIKFIRTKTNKFYFAIPYDVPIKKTIKEYKFGSADPGVKTFLTTYNTTGECRSFGERADEKIQFLHKRIDKLKSAIPFFKELNLKQETKTLHKNILILEDKIKNKVIDLHYNTIQYLIKYEKFYLPKFNSKEMGEQKSTYKSTKRNMNALSHYKFSQRLISKAEEVCSDVSISDEYRTTMTCGKCLIKNYKVGLSRIFYCTSKTCRYETGRDINAARNNVLKYLSNEL